MRHLPGYDYHAVVAVMKQILRRASICLAVMFALLVSSALAAEQDAYPFSSPVDAERFHSLTQEIRCVVCQNQNIADSNAPLANDLRAKIYMMVNEHKSNNEIKRYLVKRYGEFILLSPPLMKTTLLLWLFPFISLALIVFMLKRVMTRRNA